MKLVSNKQKRTTAIIAIAVAIVALIAIIGVVVLLTSLNTPDSEEPPVPTMAGIAVSREPKTTYLIGEKFDPSNILVQVVMTEQSATYFIDATDPDLTFSGFDSSVANDSVVITVAYKGHTTSFTIKVLEKPSATPVLTSIRLSDNFKTTYTLSSWINKGIQVRDVNLICTYSDGTEKEVPMLKDYVSGVDKSIIGPRQTSFTVRYSEGGVQVETTVTVTITN